MIYNSKDNESFIELLSSIVDTQLPAFVREDHPRFVEFIQAYFEWLEEEGNATHLLKNLYAYQDIDSSIDDFSKHLKKEFLANIPESVLCDSKTLLKNIREFYQAKGSEKSYQCLFRFLYNSSCEFYYPRTDIFRGSDGIWIQPKVIRLVSVTGNIHDFVNKKITGSTSNATAIVDSVNTILSSGFVITELRLNKNSITKNFDVLETVTAEDDSASGVITPILIGGTIISGGLGYSVDDIIETTGSGFAGKLKVSAVSDSGAITGIKILSFGAGFTTNPIFTYPPATSTAIISPIIGSIGTYEGFFLNENGELSTTKYLHDGHYYQQFSYVLKVSESINNYREIVKKLIHPAGLALYGSFSIQTLLDLSLSLTEYSSILKQTSSSYSSERIVEDINTLLQIEKSRQDYSYAMTLNYRDLERNKFNYKQFEKYDANTEMGAEYDTYWGDSSTASSTTFITDTSDDTITLSRTVNSLDEIKVYNHTTRTELTASVDYSLSSSTVVTLSNAIATTEDNVIYVYYLNYSIGNTQLKDIKDLVLADFENTPYADIKIAPDATLINDV